MTSRKFNLKSLLLILGAGLILFFGYNYFFSQEISLSRKKGKASEPLISTPNSPNVNSTSTDISPNVSHSSAKTADNSNDVQASQQLQILEEILKSQNDNDPRLDKELLIIRSQGKSLFRERYKKLPAEKRNDRGTIIFLLGRNLNQVEDFNFLKDVLDEAPCLSLSDCNRAEDGGHNREQDEHQGGFAVSLAYPQLVSLHSLENYLLQNPQGPFADKARDLIASATHSKVIDVAKMAEAIQSRLK